MSKQIENISSERIESILDALMAPAITAIDGCSDLYAVTVSDALAAKAFDVRHRPSRSDTFLHDAASFLITRDKDVSLRLKLNHDRNIAMCDKFLWGTAGVDEATKRAIQLNSTQLSSIGDAIMATAPGRLFLARCEVQRALKNVLVFRKIIYDKYERLAIQSASSHQVSRFGVNPEVALNQAKKSVYIAIDRYSSQRGVLASYIMLWIRQSLLDKENLQEGAAVEFSGGSKSHMSTVAVSLDSEELAETLPHNIEGHSDRNAEHTRALSAIPSLRPVLRSTGESLRYPLNNRERSLLIKVA